MYTTYVHVRIMCIPFLCCCRHRHTFVYTCYTLSCQVIRTSLPWMTSLPPSCTGSRFRLCRPEGRQIQRERRPDRKWMTTENMSILFTATFSAMYRITGYLCDPEICAFWPRILNVCGFYLCTALHGVWLSYCRYKLCELYLCDFSFTFVIA